MMDLILWRHAEAEYDAPSDLKRRLTSRGHKQAEKMAQWLSARLDGKKPRLFASGALRAQETLAALSHDFVVDPRLNPGTRPERYLEVCGWPGDGEGSVIIAGHQPEIGRLAGLLLSGREQDWSVKKGAIWWFQRRERAGYVECNLRVMMTPDML
ncbi:phosphohistidine phosphatase, SixA [Formivibrio citricus]|uniref:Phosphohistidine phosphatase, SixA n=1 Tax=Formivibrio citricus TaxID=83765 RepID=A0A1I5C5G3_9NEIS|nr:histidine phosphatase family protein [Formivibrio citricus]SFN82243.1 phosphohistidine phosphatase, SixA [Formivibrio citricus]